MLIVGDCIVSEDIAECCFACPLDECKGECCVEGDAGAPLTEEEVTLLNHLLPQVVPYMTKAGRKAVRQQGVSELDCTEEPCTTLVNGEECAFVYWQGDKALCAIEKAYRDGKINFIKPISCHLYPLRLANYGEFTSVNYHRWEVCRCAVKEGERQGVPLYKYLREPLVRRFGRAWYDELVSVCDNYLSQKDVKNKKKL